MNWKQYAVALLVFNLLGALAVYALQRSQLWLPLNPQDMAAVGPDSSFNTAVSPTVKPGSASIVKRPSTPESNSTDEFAVVDRAAAESTFSHSRFAAEACDFLQKS